MDDFDLVAVGIGQAHAFAAAGLVDVLDRRGAVDARDLLEVLNARGMNGETDIAGLAQFGHMDVMRCIGAAHVEGILRPISTDHAEIGQELLLLVEIGRAQPPISEVEGFDRRHDYLPKRTCPAILEHFEVGPEQGIDRRNWVPSMTARSSARSSGRVYREALPVAAEPQIGEKSGGVLMEMQKCLAADIEYPRPPLDKSGPASQALQQIAQSLERGGASVFHLGLIV